MNRARALFNYSMTRLALAPLMLWLISTLVFLLLRIAPGDPVDAILGNRADEAAREAMRMKLGLNQPLLNQYLKFINDLVHGDLGFSLNTQEAVSEIISKALPASIELAFAALIFATVIGFSIGFAGILKPNGKTDFAGRLYGIGTYALPPFWAAMLIQLFFAVILGWFPVGGRFPLIQPPPEITGFLVIDSLISFNFPALIGTLRHLFLPSFTLGFLLSGIFSRSLRVNMEKSLLTGHIEAARTRGINKNQIIFSHALPNALLPVLTITGLTVASLIGGALLIEITFSWPGIALRLQEAISQRDYPIVQGIIVVISMLVVTVGVVVDLLIALLDPRVSY
ncbi:ABC transporter permease [Prochlorococcus sp. MIT 0601]|uniref:ABC transporter permease n=1 Tax=Prochlorococcus sp. MIT 0601 TaxID=1499498 RepID=UPI0005631A90|nr:ABC transporter permease [Prochlorococcus sp. MIT 0601]